VDHSRKFRVDIAVEIVEKGVMGHGAQLYDRERRILIGAGFSHFDGSGEMKARLQRRASQ
jgi:hypothetical protein